MDVAAGPKEHAHEGDTLPPCPPVLLFSSWSEDEVGGFTVLRAPSGTPLNAVNTPEAEA